MTAFSLVPIVDSVIFQVILPLPSTHIERVIPNQFYSQTRNRNLIQATPLIKDKVDKIIFTDEEMDQFDIIIKNFIFNSIQFRGGVNYNDFFYIVLFIWLCKLQNSYVEGFQPIRPPHHELTPQSSHQRPPSPGGYGSSNSRLNLDLSNKDNSFKKFNPARIQNFYNSLPDLGVEGTDLKISAWPIAKHLHHSPDFGLDPANFGMTQADLNNIANVGLINHIRQGRIIPSKTYVIAFQRACKDFAEDNEVRNCGIGIVRGKKSYVLKHDTTRCFLAFTVENGEIYTGYKLTRLQSKKYNQENIIGKNY
jgi:hypothetical protein